MEQNPNGPEIQDMNLKNDDFSLVKLHSLLCFLMTRFHKDQSPKLAQFIVSQIRMVIEHPEVIDASECRFLYMELLQQWQNITKTLLNQGKATH